MPHSDFLPFAAAPGANVSSQADWIADPTVPEGFIAGILPSAKTNKALRQSSFIAAGVGQMVMQTLGVDVLDDGNLGLFTARLTSTITVLGGGGGVGGAVPEAPNDGRLYGRGSHLWLPTIAKSGDTMTGILTLSGPPIGPSDAVTKAYADAIGGTAGNAVQRGGDTMTGLLILSGDPTAVRGAATKQYVDALRTFAAANYAPITSPVLAGSPTAPTPATADNSAAIATTAFVKGQLYAPLASPGLTGTPTAPTAAAGTSSTQIATTAFIATSFAPLASPALTGTPTAPTAATATNTTQLATTAFVKAQGYVLGGPYVPTAGGVISGTSPGQLIIQRNSAAMPPGPPGNFSPLWINFADLEAGNILLDGHGGIPSIFLRRANGSGLTPSQSLAGDDLGNFTWRGYGTTGYTTPVGRLQLVALEPFSDTANGSRLNIGTAAVGGTTVTTQVAIGPGVTTAGGPVPSGGIQIGDLSTQRIFANSFASQSGMQVGSLAFQNSPAGADIGPGGIVLSQQLLVNRNAAAPGPPPTTLPTVRLIGGDNEAIAYSMETYNSNAVAIFQRANGTGVLPLHINNTDALGSIIWRGFGTSFTGVNAARIAAFASQDWVGGVQGTQIQIFTTPNNTSAAAPLQVAIGQGLTVGAPAAPAGGMLIGDINCQRLFVNGVLVTVP